jgi:hypothetical protein
MTGPSEAPTTAERALLRHYLAATAYRTQKALRGAPVGYADFRAAPGVRTPHQLLRHMSDVLGYARTLFTGGAWRAETLPRFADEIERFHEVLRDLAHWIEEGEFERISAGELLQGPLADAMTHAGQLAMLRRLQGSPVPPENFVMAEVDPGNLGTEQAAAADPDADWYDAEEEPW